MTCFSRHWVAGWAILQFAALALPSLSCIGRSGEPSADGGLNRLIAAYEKASSYADAGELHFRTTTAADKVKESPPIPFSVAYERPNKLRVHAYETTIISDGKLLHASVPDRPDQVLELKAPRQLILSDVLGDPVLEEAMQNEFGAPLVPLRLLTADDPLGLSSSEPPKVRRLKDLDLKGEVCQRFEVTGPEGKSVYWVDAKRNVLHRVEFPNDRIKKRLPAEVSNVEVWADFKGARLDEPVAEHAFEFEVPKNAILVSRFIGREPQPPPDWLGARMPPFSFVDLEGNKVTGDSLSGKVVVLDLWATWCGWCIKGFPNLEQVYQRYKDNPKVAILAVSTDEPAVKNEQLLEVFTDNKWHIPIVRDVDNLATGVLRIAGLPTTLILGSDGSIQEMEAGYNPNLVKDLPEKLDRLLAGANFAKDTIARYNAERQEYDRQLREVRVAQPDAGEPQPAKIADRSNPSSHKLTKLWTAEGLKDPGNLLSIESEGDVRLIVVDGYRSVAEVDLQGTVIERHELDIPEQAAINFLRTAVDGEGRRYFVAFAYGQQQFHLFDAQWKRLISYPDSEHAGLSDVQLADLDGDGTLEIYAGYFGVVGVQRVSLAGERQWSYRELENVLRLAVTPADADGVRSLVCTNGRGTLVTIDHEGKKTGEVGLPEFPLHTIVAAHAGSDNDGRYCALSTPEPGTTVAIGLSDKLQEEWTYHLPDGVQSRPVETIVSGRLQLSNSFEWLLPAADGSVHILAADGTLIDKFSYGSALTGLGVVPGEEGPVLAISSTAGLTGWRIERAE